jgi:hypothetical protein
MTSRKEERKSKKQMAYLSATERNKRNKERGAILKRATEIDELHKQVRSKCEALAYNRPMQKGGNAPHANDAVRATARWFVYNLHVREMNILRFLERMKRDTTANEMLTWCKELSIFMHDSLSHQPGSKEGIVPVRELMAMDPKEHSHFMRLYSRRRSNMVLTMKAYALFNSHTWKLVPGVKTVLDQSKFSIPDQYEIPAHNARITALLDYVRSNNISNVTNTVIQNTREFHKLIGQILRLGKQYYGQPEYVEQIYDPQEHGSLDEYNKAEKRSHTFRGHSTTWIKKYTGNDSTRDILDCVRKYDSWEQKTSRRLPRKSIGLVKGMKLASSLEEATILDEHVVKQPSTTKKPVLGGLVLTHNKSIVSAWKTDLSNADQVKLSTHSSVLAKPSLVAPSPESHFNSWKHRPSNESSGTSTSLLHATHSGNPIIDNRINEFRLGTSNNNRRNQDNAQSKCKPQS